MIKNQKQQEASALDELKKLTSKTLKPPKDKINKVL